jgi:predicted O-linked N-acetylglucosamine transferase (SPINDLY family)
MSEAQSQTLSASEAHARGHALVDAGRFDEAMDAYRTVMALAPPPGSSPNELAVVCNEVASRLRANGRSRESITWCQRAIQAAPESAELHTNLGAAWMEIGGAKEARASLQRAIELNPELGVAYSNLATLLHKAGELQEALLLYRRAAELEPEFIYPRVHALSLARELSQWSNWYEDLAVLRTLTPAPENTGPQLDLLYLPLTPPQLRQHAEAFAANMMPHESAAASAPVDDRADANEIAPLAANTRVTGGQAASANAQVDPFAISRASAVANVPANVPASANVVLAANVIARTHSPSPLLRLRRPPRGNRIRVGYVSDELRRHATGSLMAELLELHDKQRFDVHLYTWGHLDGSVVERRLRCS